MLAFSCRLHALVVQWIGHRPAESKIRVRFLSRAQFITWSENPPARGRAVRRRGWAKSESVLQANANSVGGQNETETDSSFFIIQKHIRSEEHTSELQSQFHLVCRLLL